MRVHITVYSKANHEPAQSKWFNARTFTAAEAEALDMRRLCALKPNHDCALDAFVLSRRTQGDWRLKVALAKDFPHG